jgi:antitoxin CptB
LSGSQISSQGLDARRRRLLFRSWHRGIQEMDLVLGRFADAQIARLNDAELDEYERLLEIPDQQMFAWVSGAEITPAEIDSALFRRLRDFHREGPPRT